MGLREGDSLNYLRFKQNLAETDCNAVFSNGIILPVQIRAGGSQLFVELEDYKFYDPEKLPGFVRFEHKPDAHLLVVEVPPVEPDKIEGSSWMEQRASAEKQARLNLSQEQEARKLQQGFPASRDSALTKASHEFAQAVASQRGQSGPNSKVR